MRTQGNNILLAATDLSNHLACRHHTTLDLAAARGLLDAPTYRDPALAVLQERGLQHERAYLDHLAGQGRTITVVADDMSADSAVERTRALMRDGADVIAQASLASGSWQGRADVLMRVATPSDLGEWSYEVLDTKLARQTKAGTVLQLCLYSDLVYDLQGILPENMYVVSPGAGFTPEAFRADDYLAYYRLIRRRLEQAVAQDDPPGGATYPEPVEHCEICRWWQRCDRRRRDDDHLSLVAGISRLQRREFESRGVTTLEALAALPVPLEPRPSRGTLAAFTRAREQARVQMEGRVAKKPVHELLAREDGQGLARLPEPSPGDIFFDIEGDAFVGESGLEYLFGFAVPDPEAGAPLYDRRWAFAPHTEKDAFEWFVDAVIERWQQHPDLHIYHFAPYEPSAVKRLMGRYATREEEVDRMLRSGLFVDLYAVVRQALRASVEHYSIKDLEIFYGYAREVPLREASLFLRGMERALELDRAADVRPEALAVVEGYNRDDCISTLCLRDWLEKLRAGLVEAGEEIARPQPASGEPSEKADQRRQRVAALEEALAGDVPFDRSERTPEEHARWLLAQMLDWHRREAKSTWWEYFRLRDLPPEELLYEKAALSGLEFVKAEGGTTACPIHRYRYPFQEAEIRTDAMLYTAAGYFGVVTAIDPVGQTVDVKKAAATRDSHPEAAFVHSFVSADILAESLLRLGEWVRDHGVDAPGPYRAARDLLLAHPPRLVAGAALHEDGEDTLVAARRLALELDSGILPIQGPPGAGKTYAAARMICDLVKAGKKVGITAVSHKVIRNLVDCVVKAASDEGVGVVCAQRVNATSDIVCAEILELTDTGKTLAALRGDGVKVAAGTAWLWARPEFSQAVDVLFVDEAGQMSLANVLAVAQAAKSVVLLGDPQQLEQPQQGSHPEGAEASALEHLLLGHKTILPHRGLFLESTWRLHPSICAFTSEVFYESRLSSRPGLENQALEGATPFAGAGLWFVPVDHEGNQNSSPEEVERVRGLVDDLANGDVSWMDKDGQVRPLTLDDVLVVCPYNSQVSDMARRLAGARVGTVDKFQGQEAPVVIYSLTTSSPEEAPRGMEFLYSSNRFNVATSRARGVCVLVANPLLFEVDCHTPRQMQLANAFCRYLELAHSIGREH